MRSLLLWFAMIAPLLAVGLWFESPLAGIGVLAFSHGLLLLAILRPTIQWLGPVMTVFDTSRREVWLTIDDGPTDDTAELLELLERRGVKATFFVKGTLAEAHPDRLQAIVARGHTLGNHSYSHPSGTFWCLAPRMIRSEIDRCNESIRNAIGAVPSLFRAPVGFKNPAVHPALHDRSMTLVAWSARAFDTQTDDIERIVRRLTIHLSPGAIILIHQGHTWSVRAIARVIDDIRSRGYEFVIPDPGRLKTKR